MYLKNFLKSLYIFLVHKEVSYLQIDLYAYVYFYHLIRLGPI